MRMFVLTMVLTGVGLAAQAPAPPYGVAAEPGRLAFLTHEGAASLRWLNGRADASMERLADSSVRYRGIYSGVDLLLYRAGSNFEYDFVVAPHADPRQILLQFEGPAPIRLSRDGALESGALVHSRPVAYQDTPSGRRFVHAAWAPLGAHRATFRLGSYDPALPLIIDPVVAWVKTLGGSGVERAGGTALDAAGNVWLVGSTSSADFPVLNALQSRYGGAGDAFVAKFDKTGNVLWATYLGGAGQDDATRVEIDKQGNAYVVGTTRSTDFPTTTGAFQTTLKGGADAFAVKIGPNGERLLYSTLIGGAGDDSGTSMLLDAAGFVAVAGDTTSRDLPATPDAVYRESRGGVDGYIAILDASAQRLTYATYFGGTADDTLNGIALGRSGNLYLTGRSASTNLPVTANARQSTPGGGGDAYLARLAVDKRSVDYATYIGGSAADSGVDVIVDFSEMVYVSGNTSSTNFPVFPAGSSSYHGGESDVFLVQFMFLRPEGPTTLAAAAAEEDALPRALGLLETPGASKNRREAGYVPDAPAPVEVLGANLFGFAGADTTNGVRLTTAMFFKVLFVAALATWGDSAITPDCPSPGPGGGFILLGPSNQVGSEFYRCDGPTLDISSLAANAVYEVVAGTDQSNARLQVYYFDPITAAVAAGSAGQYRRIENQGAGGDPVATATGELYEDELDLLLGGPLPLSLVRHYGSNLQTARFARSALGTNWMHNFDLEVRFLDQAGTQVGVVLFRGKVIPFRRAGNAWVLQLGLPVQYQLTTDASGYRLFDPEELILYTFNTAAKITRIEDLNGNALTITQGTAGPTRVADGLGRTLDFTYSGTQLVRVTDAFGRAVEFAYAGGNLSAVTYPDGKRVSYEYTTAGTRTTLLTRRILPEGNVPLTQQYDTLGRVVRQTDSRGNAMQFAYESVNARFTEITDPTGAVTRHRGSPLNLLNEVVDPEGNRISFEYDFNGNRTGVKDRDAAVTGAVFDTIGNVVVQSERDGATTRNTYTRSNFSGFTFERPASTTHPDGSVTRYVYDSRGNLTSLVDRAGQTWAFTYTQRGQPATARTPSGGTASAEYNPDGTPSSLRLLTGETIRFEYSLLPPSVRLVRGDNSSRRFTLDLRNRGTSLTDERGGVTAFGYDGNGRLTSVTNPAQSITRIGYDPDNRAVSLTDPLNQPWRFGYDPVGRLASVTDPTSVATRLSYDRPGRLSSIGDTIRTLGTLTRSAEGAITSVTNAVGLTWRVESDARQRPTAITDPAGNKNRATYNNMGQLTSLSDAMGDTLRWTYDSAGRLQRVTTPENEVTTLAYNPDSRVNLVTDPRGNAWRSERDGAGRITASTDPTGLVTRYDYNSVGLPSRVTRADGSTALFTYDAAGGLTREAYSDGTQVDYTRDNLGRVTRANGVTLAYDALDRVIESNGIRNEYDGAGRLVAIFHDPTRVIRYAYDNRGLLTRITDWTGRVWEFTFDAARRQTTARAPNGVVSTYSYGADGRLSGIRHAGGSLDVSAALERDGLGRVTQITGNLPTPNVSPGTLEFSYLSNNRVVGREYDGRGNMTRDGERRITWNGRDLPVRASGPGGADVLFEFDAFGYPTRVGDRAYVWNYATDPPLLAEIRALDAPRTQAGFRGDVGDPPIVVVINNGTIGVRDRDPDAVPIFAVRGDGRVVEIPPEPTELIALVPTDTPTNVINIHTVPGGQVQTNSQGASVGSISVTLTGEVTTQGTPNVATITIGGGQAVQTPRVGLAYGLAGSGVIDTFNGGRISAADTLYGRRSYADHSMEQSVYYGSMLRTIGTQLSGSAVSGPTFLTAENPLGDSTFLTNLASTNFALPSSNPTINIAPFLSALDFGRAPGTAQQAASHQFLPQLLRVPRDHLAESFARLFAGQSSGLLNNNEPRRFDRFNGPRDSNSGRFTYQRFTIGGQF